MLVTTKAIVVSAIKYAEADLIVKAYTEQSGLKSYMLKGILKSKKGKFKASQFQVLTQLELVARHKDKGKLDYLKDAKLLLHYQSLHSEVVKATLALFLAEILRYAIQEEEANPPLFHYLTDSFVWLDTHAEIANFHLLFLLKLTEHLGFRPELSQKEFPYFNLLEGVFQNYKSNAYCIEGENVEILRQLVSVSFNELGNLKISRSARANFLKVILLYYELHLEGFRKPKSLRVLNEIFS